MTSNPHALGIYAYGTRDKWKALRMFNCLRMVVPEISFKVDTYAGGTFFRQYGVMINWPGIGEGQPSSFPDNPQSLQSGFVLIDYTKLEVHPAFLNTLNEWRRR